MEIKRNSDKDREESNIVSLSDPGGGGGVSISAVGGAGVHSTDQVYSQIKTLLGIPEDEPIFILRAQDKFSLRMIRTYKNCVRDGVRDKPDTFNDWLMNMSESIGAFVRWQKNHTVKVPD